MKKFYCVTGEPSEFVEAVKKVYRAVLSRKKSKEEITDFVKEAFSTIKPCERDEKLCFWMFDEPSTMPSDCRVFYVYETTYMITAAIISATIQYPELRELPDYLDIMTKAFNGCMGRGFLGHGYDALEGFLSAMDIFAGSGIEKYLKIYGTEFPEFTAYWNEKGSILKEQILSGKWRTDWSNISKSKEAAVIISKLENER